MYLIHNQVQNMYWVIITLWILPHVVPQPHLIHNQPQPQPLRLSQEM